MIRLVEAKSRLLEGSPRLWLVFFGNAAGGAWWSWLCRSGFRHVRAAAYYADQERWIYYDPARRGTMIEIYTAEEFGPRMGQLVADSAAVLRVQSRFGRGATPAVWHCVGAVKALLGVRCRALTPLQLFRHLRATGAEPVEVPKSVISRRLIAATAAGGSGGEADARLGAAAG